jgi:biopolymer transport protein ExbD/biopolymer transport protein TolR
VFTDINVTPLTDVFLVLLVIMILIAPLVNQTVLKVDPPTSGAAKPQPDDKGPKINVDVSAAGVVKINDRTLNQPDTMQVAEAIKAEQQKAGKDDIPLNLTSDGDALQKYVVAVMDAAAGAGIKQLRVMPLKNK